MALMHLLDLLERNLARLCNSLEGMRSAVIVSVEGLVVASHPPGDESFLEDGSPHSSQMAAMASTLARLGLGRAAAKSLAKPFRVDDMAGMRIFGRCIFLPNLDKPEPNNGRRTQRRKDAKTPRKDTRYFAPLWLGVLAFFSCPMHKMCKGTIFSST